MSFYSELIKFFEQSKTGDLRTNHYEKEYRGLKVKVSFGQGNVAKIPWISFLGEQQKTLDGIYPVYLYYRNKGLLILAYGVSETNKPQNEWELNEPIKIKEYFAQNNLGKPDRYGDSFIFKVYNVDDLPPRDEIDRDLNQIIDEYKSLDLGNSSEKTHKKDLEKSNDLFESNEMIPHSFNTQASTAGLKFSSTLVTRFIASLITKQFVICSGLSGSGKSKLAQSFALWLCDSPDQFKMVPVGADWTNREPLLGYPNALDDSNYVMPDSGVLSLILHSINYSDLPHFLILDEMNLSHVERYFADFLSTMESGEAIPLYSNGERYASEDAKAENDSIPNEIFIPKNLFIIGTVNIDETTYMFSPKVLDRANVIEFRISPTEMEEFLKEPPRLNLDVLKGVGSKMAETFMDLATNPNVAAFEKTNNSTLLSFFKELQKQGAEFGYRSASEIYKLIGNLGQLERDLPSNGRLTTNQKLDIAIMQKLLPRLHGSRSKLSKVLLTLAGFCVVEGVDIRKNFFENDEPNYNQQKVKFPLSLEKITRMHKNAMENGFASYAEA
ncbi:MAG: DUF3578 domain-containing protein [Balneolales bacterium]